MFAGVFARVFAGMFVRVLARVFVRVLARVFVRRRLKRGVEASGREARRTNQTDGETHDF